jgi:hypothetical protein
VRSHTGNPAQPKLLDLLESGPNNSMKGIHDRICELMRPVLVEWVNKGNQNDLPKAFKNKQG